MAGWALRSYSAGSQTVSGCPGIIGILATESNSRWHSEGPEREDQLKGPELGMVRGIKGVAVLLGPYWSRSDSRGRILDDPVAELVS